VIDVRLSQRVRRGDDKPSENASQLNQRIVELIAAKKVMTEEQLFAALADYQSILSERLTVLSHLGLLSAVDQPKRSYSLSKLGEEARSSNYFAIE
jgi:hypothetical protein